MMNELLLGAVQDIGLNLSVCGPELELKNMAADALGRLSPVAEPRLLASLGERIVATERRRDVRYVFTQGDDGEIALALRVMADGKVEEEYTPLAVVDEWISECGSVGEFLVLRGAEGNLYYLLWEADFERHTWLGRLPEPPDVGLRLSEGVTFFGRVDAVQFKTQIEDLRQGLDSENEHRISKALEEGLAQCRENAHAGGYRVGPCMVRVAWRLWDGRLLHISAPRTVEISQPSALGLDRVLLPLAWGTKGWSGTEAGEVSLQGYQVWAKPFGTLPAAWREVIKGAEIWVSEPVPLTKGEAVTAYSNAGGKHVLSCSYRSLTHAEQMEALPGQPMARQVFSPMWEEEVLVGIDSKAVANPEITGESTPAVAMSLSGKADALLCHGGFMHVARGRSVVTSQLGNPFVYRSETADVGGEAISMWPQLRGGGAYTRQYLYVATKQGLTALMHDSQGVHTNSRQISKIVVADAVHGVATSLGLMISGEGGELVRVRDARVEPLLQQVRGVEHLGWVESRQTLLLCGQWRTLALPQSDRIGEARGYEWALNLQGAAGEYGGTLGVAVSEKGEWRLYDLTRRQQSPGPEQSLLVRLEAAKSGKRVVTLGIAMRGAADFSGRIECEYLGRRYLLRSFKCRRGAMQSTLQIPVYTYSPRLRDCTVTVSLKGRLPEIEKIFWI